MCVGGGGQGLAHLLAPVRHFLPRMRLYSVGCAIRAAELRALLLGTFTWCLHLDTGSTVPGGGDGLQTSDKNTATDITVATTEDLHAPGAYRSING